MISIKNIALFKKSFEAISLLIDETNVRFKSSGIFIKAVDKTQILLVEFEFPKTAFDTYVVEPNLVGLNILELYNMVSRSFDKDKLQLELKDNNIDINLSGVIKRKFNLPYRDISDSEITIPSISYDCEIHVSGYLLKEILKDVSLIGSTLILRVQDNKFLIEAQGDHGKLNVVVPKAKVKSKKDSFAKFSVAYLKKIVKSIDNETNVLLKLKGDSPLFISYDIENKVKISIYLSPMLI